MSLPPGFLDELRNRLSLAQVVGRKVTWDARKSNQAKGDLWAACPFHQEKSASFHVDDRKGYYYCFGCHQKGDAISFVRETENVSFMEAVEILTREAGMQMPARDPQAQEKDDRRSELADVMEQVVRWYRLQLKTGAAAPARDYLAQRRGLSEAALERWEIGFAPPGWQGLRDHLKGKGVPDELMIAAGLIKPSDKGREPYDVFRNRIMFPIRDARGRAIAFGARAMDPADPAKYLNSPETVLFDKGRSLYNRGPAREAAGKGQPLIVAEGYMDVIALSEAGFKAAVAPLGTAITEDQLALFWRIHPEPVIALDGDKAGIAAGMRLLDLALPRIEAGQSLRFALLPEGQDPDDLIKTGGPSAMQAVVEAAQPMVRLLWRRETEGQDFDSPERKAGLDKALRERILTIRDPSIRRHYFEEVDALRRALFAPAARALPSARGRSGAPFRAQGVMPPTSATRNSALVSGDALVEERLREAVILATLVTHPGLIERFEADLEKLEFCLPEHGRLRTLILGLGDRTSPEALATEAGAEALEKLFAPRHVQISPGVRDAEDHDRAALCLAEELAKLEARRGARREIEEAVEDLSDIADEGITWRLSQAAAARNAAERGRNEDKAEYEIAPNGLRMRRDEIERGRSLFDAIRFSRTGPGESSAE